MFSAHISTFFLCRIRECAMIIGLKLLSFLFCFVLTSVSVLLRSECFWYQSGFACEFLISHLTRQALSTGHVLTLEMDS